MSRSAGPVYPLHVLIALALAGAGCAPSAGSSNKGGTGGTQSPAGGRGGSAGGTGGSTGGSGSGTGGSIGGSGSGTGGSTGGAAGGSAGGSTGGSGSGTGGSTGGTGSGIGGSTGGSGTGGSTGAGGSGGSSGPDAAGGTGGVAPPMPVNVYPCNWGPPVITRLAPSTSPPGGLAVDNVPLFVSLGFDDNMYVDGMTWIVDFMKSKMNPAGRGNPCTFDGSPARASFFNNSHVAEMTEPGIKDAHLRAYREGHEAANHTDTHAETLQRNMDRALWNKELSTCNDYHVAMGIPREHLIGFRTPFLQQSEQTFEAILEQKFKYDCSIEHFYGPGGFVWPYTLENGKAPMHTYQTFPMGKYPGLWELPVYELMTSTMGYQSVTGFDYNIWIARRMTKQQAVDLLKASLEIRLVGGNSPANRAPLLIGAHTDLYSSKNMVANMTAAASVADRRAAIEEFITWALARHPSVRVVPYAEVLHWMQAPVGLDGTKGR